jgi:hypothetical protein
MPNIFDQIDTPTATVAPEGKNPFDAFDGNPFDQFDEPLPLKSANFPGKIKLNPLQQVQLQSRLRDPENPTGQDNTFLTALSEGGSPVAFAKNLATVPIAAPISLVGEAINHIAAPIMNALADVGEVDTPIVHPANQPSGTDAMLYQLGLAKKPENYNPDEFFQPGQPMLPKELFPYAAENQKGVLPAMTRAALGMITPENALLAGAAPLAPEAMGSGFFAETAASLPDSLQRMATARNADDFKDAATEFGLNVGMAALMAHGLIPKVEPVMTPEDAAANRAAVLASLPPGFEGSVKSIRPAVLAADPVETAVPVSGVLPTEHSDTVVSEKVDNLAATIKSLETAIRDNQLRPSVESPVPTPVSTADETSGGGTSQDNPVFPASVASQLARSRLGVNYKFPVSEISAAVSEPDYVHSLDGIGGLDDQATQEGIKNYLRQQEDNVPPVQIVNAPNWTHNGYGVRGTVQDGKIIVNQAFINSADTLQKVLREEHNHVLLSSDEGRQAIRYAAKNNLGLPQLADLSAKYPIQPGESVAGYRLRLTDEFISKAASEQLPAWKQIVERVKGWLADKGIGELNDEETARAIVRALKSGKTATEISSRFLDVDRGSDDLGRARNSYGHGDRAAPFDAPQSEAGGSGEENADLSARYNLTGKPLKGMSTKRTTEALNEFFKTEQLAPAIRVIQNPRLSWDVNIHENGPLVLNAAEVSTPEEAQRTILRGGLSDIWYQRGVQRALRYVRSNLTPDELMAEFNRRKAQGLRTDPPIVQDGAAISRLAKSDSRDRIVQNCYNAIRAELGKKFGFNVPVTVRPQLNEAAIQFLRNRTLPAPGLGSPPLGMVPLGQWGEAWLSHVLRGAGIKSSNPLKTSLTFRFIDRIVNKIAHEAKAGLNVKLNDKIRTQILKDKDIIKTKQAHGAHWHFFRGAQPDVLNFLEQNDIPYTVY